MSLDFPNETERALHEGMVRRAKARRKLSPADAVNMHAEIVKSITRSHKNAAELIRRGQHVARDGYASSSMGGSGGGSDISRPTERAATAPPMQDGVGNVLAAWSQNLIEILEKAKLLENQCDYVLSIAVEERGRQNSIPDCVNPNCGVSLVGHGSSDRGTALRCDPCYEYRRTHGGDDRPKRYVDAQREREERKRAQS